MKLTNALLLCSCFVIYFFSFALSADDRIDGSKTTYGIEDRYFLNHQINLDYEVKSLGLKVAKMRFEVNLTESQFFSNAMIKTQGIGDLFSNSTWAFSSRGTLEESKVQPKFYNNHIKTKKGVGHISIVYRDGLHNILARPAIPEEKEIELYKNLNTGVIDPIASIIEMSLYPSKDICSGSREVTDGRRIFSITYILSEDLGQCSLKYVPLTGFSDKEYKKESDSPTPPFLIKLAKVKIKNNFSILIPTNISTSEGVSSSIDLKIMEVNGESVSF